MGNLYLLVVLLFCFSYSEIQGKTFSINFSLGYNSYDLKDLKTYASDYGDLYAVYDLPVKKTKNFPSSASYGFELYYYDKADFPPYAIYVEFFETTGLLEYSDLPTRLKAEFTLTAWEFGLIIEKEILSDAWGTYFIQIRPGIIFNNLNFSEIYRVADESAINDVDFENRNYSLSVLATYKILYGEYSIQPYAGYQINSQQSLHLKYSSQILQGFDNENVPVNWRGFRLGLIFGLSW